MLRSPPSYKRCAAKGEFLVKRASLIVSFWAVLFVSFAIINAEALPDGATDGIIGFGASQDSAAPQENAGPQKSAVLQDSVANSQTMMASYYDYSHAGNMTANGDIFDPAGFTAAHRTIPFGTQLLVSYGGNSVQVTVNDRGPYVDGIDLDLSQAAAERIGLIDLGVAPVEVIVL
jgi:rare lipoprotein A (peptidoglycan hydrolase)